MAEFKNSFHAVTAGTFWSAVGKYSNYLTQFIVIAVLSRLLEPKDFGVLGMVTVYTGFLNVLAEGGITNSVIRFQKISKKGISSIFWFSIIFSVIVYIGTFFLAFLIEDFYDFEGLARITQVISVGVIFLGVSVVPVGLLKRDMQFRKLSISDVIPSIGAGAIAIIFAFIGFGVWALVINTLLFYFIKSIIVMILSKWRPRLSFEKNIIKEVLSFSSYLIGFNSVNYWSRNADNLIVGKVLGADSLGYYSQAYKLMMLPNQMITSVVNTAILPVLASFEDNSEKISNLYIQITELLSLITILIGSVMFFNAETIVILIWGSKWIGSIGTFKILSFLTIFQPIVSTAGSVFISTGRSKLLFKLGLGNSAIMISGMLIGLYLWNSIEGVATGYALGYLCIVFPVTMWFVTKVLKIKFAIFMRSFWFPLLTGACSFAMQILLRLFPDEFLNNNLRLLISFLIVLFMAFILYIIRYKKLFLSYNEFNN